MLGYKVTVSVGHFPVLGEQQWTGGRRGQPGSNTWVPKIMPAAEAVLTTMPPLPPLASLILSMAR